MNYEYVHSSEKITIDHQPELGMDDVSKCLPGWIKTLCDAFETGDGITLSHQAVSNLAHTLIAARRRQHRLIEERDHGLRRTDSASDGITASSQEMGVPVKATQVRIVDSADGPKAVRTHGALVEGKFVPQGDN